MGSWTGCDSEANWVEHASAYASIRQHTSAYVSIRQHTAKPTGWRSLLRISRSLLQIRRSLLHIRSLFANSYVSFAYQVSFCTFVGLFCILVSHLAQLPPRTQRRPQHLHLHIEYTSEQADTYMRVDWTHTHSICTLSASVIADVC